MEKKLQRCTRCRDVHPATAEYFPAHATAGRGLRKWCRLCVQEYGEQNPTRVGRERNLYFRIYRSANRKRFQEYARQYHLLHPEIARISSFRRRAKIRNASGNHTASDIRKQYALQEGRCLWCGVEVGNVYHVDHVIPLSRGGSNGPENIAISCPSCNLRKHSKLPQEWLEEMETCDGYAHTTACR